MVPHIGEVKQIHTHIGPLDKPLFLHTAPSVKSTTPSPPYFIRKTLLKNTSLVIFTYICVFRFSILVSVAPQKCSFVWYILKHGIAHNPMLHSRHLTIVLFSLFLAEHTSPNSLTLDVWFLSWWFKRLHCLAYRILLLGHAVDWTVEWKIDINMNVKFEIVTNKSLQQNEGHLPVVPYCTNQSNERLYSFLSPPTDCIWTQHPDKPALPRKLNTL